MHGLCRQVSDGNMDRSAGPERSEEMIDVKRPWYDFLYLASWACEGTTFSMRPSPASMPVPLFAVSAKMTRVLYWKC